LAVATPRKKFVVVKYHILWFNYEQGISKPVEKRRRNFNREAIILPIDHNKKNSLHQLRPMMPILLRFKYQNLETLPIFLTGHRQVLKLKKQFFAKGCELP